MGFIKTRQQAGVKRGGVAVLRGSIDKQNAATGAALGGGIAV